MGGHISRSCELALTINEEVVFLKFELIPFIPIAAVTTN